MADNGRYYGLVPDFVPREILEVAMLYTMKECDFILDRLDMIVSELSDWERSFLQSVQVQRAAGRELSDKQVGCLSKIWDKCN